MSRRDPIIEEIHAIREAIAREHGFDAQRIARALREEALAGHKQVVSRLPKRISKARKSS
jgi:hypothetical protein